MIQSTLNQLCRIRTGKVDVNSGNPDGKYPFFTCAKEFTFSDEFDFDCEAILIAGNGEVGLSHYFNGKFQAYQRTYVLDDFRDVFVPYLKYVIDAKLIPHLKGLTHGSSIPYIRKGGLESCPVPLPPLEEQKRIAGILDEADRVRKKTQALIDKYDELAQSLFLDMFGDPVTNPKGWDIVKLEATCNVSKAKVAPDEIQSGTSYVGLEHIDPDGTYSSKIVSAGELKSTKNLFKPGQILFGKLRPYLRKTAPTTTSGICSTDVLAIQPNEDVVTQYLTSFLRLDSTVKLATEKCSGANLPRISSKELLRFSIPLPPFAIQEHFDMKMRMLTSQRDSLLRSLTFANDNFQALLQKAFKGELN